MDAVAPAIETEQLTKRYGSSRGIEDVDLVVPHGEIFGFLGPNGAGKTTTIRVLLDLLHPTSGRARLLGLDSRADRQEVHRRVGYLPGDLKLYDRLTGRELVDWFGRLRGGLPDGEADHLVERFGIELDRPIRELSKGNRQKLGLLQAFMHRPDVLVLDEPTSGLDPLVQDEFMRLVREVTAEGRTVFLSSHSLDEVQHLAHRVGILRDGRLVAVEAVDDLRARALRRVEVHLAGRADDGTRSELAALPGVRELQADGDRLRFTVSGDVDPLVKALAHHHVLDLLSTPADLEEIFLTYYRAEGGDGA